MALLITYLGEVKIHVKSYDLWVIRITTSQYFTKVFQIKEEINNVFEMSLVLVITLTQTHRNHNRNMSY